MKARSLISLIVTVAVVSAAAVVWNAADAEARRGRNTRGAHRHQAMMEALDLTAEQQEKLKSIQLNNAKRMTRLRADLKIARLDLHDLLSQSNPNPAQVKPRVAEVNRVRSEMLEKKIYFRLAQPTDTPLDLTRPRLEEEYIEGPGLEETEPFKPTDTPLDLIRPREESLHPRAA